MSSSFEVGLFAAAAAVVVEAAAGREEGATFEEEEARGAAGERTGRVDVLVGAVEVPFAVSLGAATMTKPSSSEGVRDLESGTGARGGPIVRSLCI